MGVEKGKEAVTFFEKKLLRLGGRGVTSSLIAASGGD